MQPVWTPAARPTYLNINVTSVRLPQHAAPFIKQATCNVGSNSSLTSTRYAEDVALFEIRLKDYIKSRRARRNVYISSRRKFFLT